MVFLLGMITAAVVDQLIFGQSESRRAKQMVDEFYYAETRRG